MTAPDGNGSETTKRLLEQSRELLQDLSEQLSGGEPDTAAAPLDPS